MKDAKRRPKHRTQRRKGAAGKNGVDRIWHTGRSDWDSWLFWHSDYAGGEAARPPKVPAAGCSACSVPIADDCACFVQYGSALAHRLLSLLAEGDLRHCYTYMHAFLGVFVSAEEKEKGAGPGFVRALDELMSKTRALDLSITRTLAAVEELYEGRRAVHLRGEEPPPLSPDGRRLHRHLKETIGEGGPPAPPERSRAHPSSGVATTAAH